MKTQRLFIEDGVLDLRDVYRVKKPKETVDIQKGHISRGLRKLALSFQQANVLKDKSLQEKKEIWERERSVVDSRFRRQLNKAEMEQLERTPSSDILFVKDEKVPSIKEKNTIEKSTVRAPKRVKFETTCVIEKIDKTVKPERTNKTKSIIEPFDNTERLDNTERTDKVIEGRDKTDRANKTKRSDKRDYKPEKPHSTERVGKLENRNKVLDQSEIYDKKREPCTREITIKPAVINIPKLVEKTERAAHQNECAGKPEGMKTGMPGMTEPVQPFGTVDKLIEKLHKTGINNTRDEITILPEVGEVIESNGHNNIYDCEDFVYDYNIQYQPFMQCQSTYDPFGDHDLLHNVDPRLRRKYSVLNIPKTSTSNSVLLDRPSEEIPDVVNFDNTYDEESNDSYYCKESQEGLPHDVSYSRTVLTCILVGFVIGVLVMSVLVNLIYNSNILPLVFRIKQKQEHSLTLYARYFGGGIIHIITTFFQNLGRLLSIPTQHMYAPKPEYHRWPINPLNL